VSAARTVVVFAALALLGACKVPMDTPANFVELRDGGDGWRAVTSDGARLRVRDLHDSTRATAQFWADTLRTDLVQQRGYELVASGEVANQAGGSGSWLELVANVHGERIGYLIAIWVLEPSLPTSNPYLRVVEFAARDDVFRAHVGAVRSALSTVRG
jgi:hypothetical protein